MMLGVDYTNQVFMVVVQRRTFNWTMPHQPLNNNEQAMGTAFYLRYKSKIHLITCFHVIQDAFHIAISSPAMGSKEYPCRVRWICPEMDLAVLEVKKNNILNPKNALAPVIFPRISKTKIPAPEIGAVVITVGYPLGQSHLKLTKGIMSGQQLGLYQTDAPINGGNSGGPLMWKNKVVGINSRGYRMAQNVGYAIPIMTLLHLINFHDRNPEMYQIRFPRTWGFRMSPPSRMLLPSSSQKKNKTCSIADNRHCGLEIKNVFKDQLMDGCSLRKGDILLSINGMPISALGELPLEWLNQKMTINSLLLHLFLGQKIHLKYLSGNTIREETIVIRPESEKVLYRKWYEEHEEIPYLYVAGIVLVPFNETYMERRYEFLRDPSQFRDENPLLLTTLSTDDPALLYLMAPENWNKGRLIISNVLRGGLIEETHILRVGDIIDTIGGKKTPTIQDADRIVKSLLAKKKDIEIRTLSGSILHLSPQMVKEEEARLYKIYNVASPAIDTNKNLWRRQN